MFRESVTISDQYIHVYYHASQEVNTINVVVEYTNISLKERTQWGESGKKHVKSMAKSYGWDKWLKVQVKYEYTPEH